MTDAALSDLQTLRIAVPDLLGEVDAAVARADAFAAQAGLDEDRRYALQVCIEEALANLIMHGVAGPGGKQIVVTLTASPPPVALQITDTCMPFDVTAVPPPTAGSDQAPGGRGIALMRAFSKHMRYSSEGGRNLLDIGI
ncbi:MAG: ATP-binding protein [Hyphomicrobiales bacterium]|nr:MAG: ATP-binding protein [Hyphomicrobiales bacterium]